jgi:hypothetical protein
VQGWHLEQHVGEVVYVPAGCPYQVRYLRPTTQVSCEGARGKGGGGGGEQGGRCRSLCIQVFSVPQVPGQTQAPGSPHSGYE